MFVVVLAVVAAAAPILGASAEPVAVLRFKDLSGDQALAWLSAGMQETTTTDLNHAGVVVVERGRIDAAQKELKTAADDIKGAVDVGKLVGAKTLVIGSYQQQGNEVRLVARFVDVSTGEVKGAHKVTGPTANIFALQDQLIDEWLPQQKKQKAKKAATTTQRLAAYQKLGEALSSSSPSAQASLLTQALSLDPTFSYASTAMASLTKRVDAALDKGVEVALDDAAGLRDVAVGAGAVDGRVAAGRKALTLLRAAHCFHALLSTSEALLATPSLAPLFEAASAARVHALWRLRRADLALQAGEKHLHQFAGGASTEDVRGAVRDVAEQKRTLPERERDYADDANDPSDVFRPCIAAKWALLPDKMEQNCAAYVKAHGNDADVDVRDHVRAARVYVAWSFALRGDFAKAWKSANDVDAKDAGALDDVGLRKVMDETWSRDR